MLCALALTVPAIAAAATKNGITPVAPKAGSTVKLGTAPTFKMRVRGKGSVWVHVCKSPKRSKKEGVICGKEVILKAKRKKGNLFQVKATFFDFPEFWLNRAGTYYWQSFRIFCNPGNTKDCKQEGPVVRFKVG